MLTSKVRHRLAQKTSALGLMGTLVLFAGSLFVGPAPAAAESSSVAVDKPFTYTCTGGPFSKHLDQCQAQCSRFGRRGHHLRSQSRHSGADPHRCRHDGVDGGSHSRADADERHHRRSATAKTGAAIAVRQHGCPAGDATYRVTVTTGATGKVSIKPGQIKLAVGTTASAAATTCTTVSTDVLDRHDRHRHRQRDRHR